MTESERRENARLFCQKWKGKGKEDEDDQKFWIEILQNILGIENVTDKILFQKKVVVDGNTKRIDAYIPETRVIIEQKTLGIALDKKGSQSGGIELTPYEQAKRYNDNLPFDEKARWIVTSNFAEIWIYDMNMKVPEPVKLMLENIKDQFGLLDFLIDKKEDKVSQEVKISIDAGKLISNIHDLFLKQYKDPNSPETLKSLNKLCVRLVFCYYAEDSGLFPGINYFSKYTKNYKGNDFREAIIRVFKTLNTPEAERDPYIDEGLNAFPYVNGGLFEDEKIEIPRIDDELREAILYASTDFDWSPISPTIFGAVFESTLNPETRRAGGMHYTSIENIHKVIDPLFLDNLKREFEEIKTIAVAKDKSKKLLEFQEKLSKLKFLDPACGSGNFLTETYVSLRRLENEVIRILHNGQMFLGIYEGKSNPIKVSINQFYGIEINDFAVTVAKTALWIAESQMMKETEDIVLNSLNFLPLKTNATIVEGNALRIDWETVVSKSELNYIMGNPPFVGYSLQNNEQKADILSVYVDEKGKPYKTAGKIDYVSAWYFKAAEYICKRSEIREQRAGDCFSQRESLPIRHCEEQSDEAIQTPFLKGGSQAMPDRRILKENKEKISLSAKADIPLYERGYLEIATNTNDNNNKSLISNLSSLSSNIKVAFVSTNSITQGEQVSAVWKPLYERFGVDIDFAHRTFKWNSEATDKAAVHCVIVGFGCGNNEKLAMRNEQCPKASPRGEVARSAERVTEFVANQSSLQQSSSQANKKITIEQGVSQRTEDYSSSVTTPSVFQTATSPQGEALGEPPTKRLYENGKLTLVSQINPYLIEAEPIFIESRSKPLCNVPEMKSGGKPVEGGNLIFTSNEKDEFIKKEPNSEKWFRKFMGSDDFINGETRYCLWLVDISPNELKKMPEVMKRVDAVKNFRLASVKEATRKFADYPTRFMEIKQPQNDYLMVPATSSENRRYIPIGFLDKNVIASNAASFVPNATLYHFGILTSNVHMSWMRVVCGRLEMRYRYSVNIVYNNFPWPNPTLEQKAKIEQTAQGILDARALYADSSLADLYDPLTMPVELKKAHQANDKAVMEAYGLDVKATSESDCVAYLMNLYRELINK